MNVSRLFNEFFSSEKAGGSILVVVTIISLVLANLPLQDNYIHLWHSEIQGQSLLHWINDGLMTFFFLLIGLELEREIYSGELSTIKKASLPVFAAVGGMLIPAGIFLLFNYGTGTQTGAGIPMATDIAFAIGILSLLGRQVPLSLKIFLTALAVIDDLGAIIVISVFYTGELELVYLLYGMITFAILLGLNKLNVLNLIPYLLGGLLMWIFMQKSGIHPSISGVMLAFSVPFHGGGEKSPSFKLQHLLHKPVAFFILPLFALANTAIPIESSYLDNLFQNYSVGIFAGFVLGKPLGIWLFAFIAVKAGISELPQEVSWKAVLGIGLLGGIGFTMAIFITLLAFNNTEIINTAKTAILISSVIAGLSGYFLLKSTFNK